MVTSILLPWLGCITTGPWRLCDSSAAELDLDQAASYGNVAASFALEQIGVTILAAPTGPGLVLLAELVSFSCLVKAGREDDEVFIWGGGHGRLDISQQLDGNEA